MVFSSRITTKLSLCFLALLCLFLSMGALSLLLARSISEIATRVNEETGHIEVTEDIESMTQRLIHGLDRSRGISSAQVQLLETLQGRLGNEVQAFYLSHIQEAVPFPEKSTEIKYIARLRDETALLGAAGGRILRAARRGRRPDASDLATLDRISNVAPLLSQQLNAIHRHKVNRLIERDHWTLALLIKIYFVCFVLGAALAALGTAILFRKIAAPLRRLTEATLSFAQGDLKKRVEPESNDEIGLLSRSFNSMAASLEERDRELGGLNALLEQKVKETQALYRIGTEISGSLDLDQILRSVVERARKLLSADTAALCLPDGERGELVMKVTSGPAVAFARRKVELGPGASGQSTCLQNDGPPDTSRGTNPFCRFLNADHVRIHLAAPLRRRNSTIGSLCVGRCEGGEFSSTEAELLNGLAAQAGVAIENANLYREVRHLAAVEERERIAREMHDGLAQALGIIHFRLDQLQESWGAGTATGISPELEAIKKVAEDAYDEVRQSIFGLRTQVSRGRKLLPVLTEYLHEFSLQTDIQVRLVVDDESVVQFPPPVEVQLIRIIQEALTNIRRHSLATRAVVNFHRNGDSARVAVRDNGRGFPSNGAATNGRNHFGLQTMRERAQSIGGTIEIVSSAETGTVVTVEFPLNPKAETQA